MPDKIALWSPPTTSPIPESFLPKNFAAAQAPLKTADTPDIVDEHDFPNVAYASRPQDRVP